MSNYKNTFNIIGKVLIVEAILMLFPLLVGIIYREPFNTTIISFLATSIGLAILGTLLNIQKAKSNRILPRESFIIVSLSWICVSLFGCLPLVISKSVPHFIDAFFEMTSGFTTTGASVISDVEALPHSVLFWRSFSHWIGGMGVIVFILAILPNNKEGSNMHILRAESPGPQVGKLTSKISVTARILYLIYIVLTVSEIILLRFGPNMDWFSSITLSLGTAGTGGFGILNDGLMSYAPYVQYVVAIFMMLFGINFTMFYLLLIGKFKSVFKNEELRMYFAIIIVSIVIIVTSLQIHGIYNTFEERFRHAFFQVTSLMSTTGYATTDYTVATPWPLICFMVIIFLMLTGPCAGSTGGGVKLSRISILCKSAVRKVKQMISPRKIEPLKDSGAVIERDVIQGAESFFVLYMIVLFACTILISLFPFAIEAADGTVIKQDVVTSFTASLSCISNIGPGLGNVIGPAGNFAAFTPFSKFVLSITMIIGRLELFPMLALFSFRTWKSR